MEWSEDILDGRLIRLGLDFEDADPAQLEELGFELYQYLMPDDPTARLVTQVMFLRISDDLFNLEKMNYFIHRLYQSDFNVSIPKLATEELLMMLMRISWTLYEELEGDTRAYIHEALKLAHRLETMRPDAEVYGAISELYQELGNEEKAQVYKALAKP